MNTTVIWQNTAESLTFLANVTNLRSRGALTILHSACLECDGAVPPHFTNGTLHPTLPVDLLALYQAVARTFEDWNEQRLSVPSSNGAINFRGVRVTVDSNSSLRMRAILTQFLMNLEQIVAVRNNCFDVAFSCQLLEACFRDEKRLDDVLSGHNGRELSESRKILR